MLRGGTYSLRTELQLGKGANLTIRGPGKIVGDAHTLFKVAGNRALLDIAGVRLEHVGSADRRERRELGAAVFVLGRNQMHRENLCRNCCSCLRLVLLQLQTVSMLGRICDFMSLFVLCSSNFLCSCNCKLCSFNCKLCACCVMVRCFVG